MGVVTGVCLAGVIWASVGDAGGEVFCGAGRLPAV